MKAIDVAKYVIAYNDNVGDLITNKKLQKLLYYIMAWGVVYFEDGIIDDEFEAWIHGPVCVVVYAEYKKFGYQPITQNYGTKTAYDFIEDFKSKNSDSDKIDLIDAVIKKYGNLTSLQLELLSHSEKPWIEARDGLSPIETGHSVIKTQTIKNFYSQQK